MSLGQLGQRVGEDDAQFRGPRDEAVALDHLENAPGAHHVGQPTAPRRVDARSHAEDVVTHQVDSAAGHDPADLGLLAERHDVGLEAELRVRPGGSGDADARLDLVEDEQGVVLVAEVLQGAEVARPEVVIAALALDRLEDEGGDVVGMEAEVFACGREGSLLERVHVRAVAEVGRGNARPVERGEARHLDRIGVGERHCVPGPAVEGVLQVQDSRAEPWIAACLLVAPALPVEGDLERVLHGERTALHEEQVRKLGDAEHAGEGVHEARHRLGVDVRVARLVQRCGEEVVAEPLVLGQRGMVHAQGVRGEEREHVEVRRAVPGVHQRGAP